MSTISSSPSRTSARHPITREPPWQHGRHGLVHHPGPPGSARPGDERDRDLLIGWFEAFAAEVGEEPGQDHAAAVDDRLGYGGITIWAAGGVPVSVACLTPVVAGVARVGPVYTPPPLRGRGYAGAATVAASQAALGAGAQGRRRRGRACGRRPGARVTLHR